MKKILLFLLLSCFCSAYSQNLKWKIFDTPSHAPAFDFTVKNNVYYAASNCIASSSDYGKSWKRFGAVTYGGISINFSDVPVEFSAIRSFKNSKSLLAVIGDNSIIASGDYGKTWQSSGIISQNGALINRNDTVYIIMNNDAAVSVDYGLSWTKLNLNLISEDYLEKLLVNDNGDIVAIIKMLFAGKYEIAVLKSGESEWNRYSPAIDIAANSPLNAAVSGDTLYLAFNRAVSADTVPVIYRSALLDNKFMPFVSNIPPNFDFMEILPNNVVIIGGRGQYGKAELFFADTLGINSVKGLGSAYLIKLKKKDNYVYAFTMDGVFELSSGRPANSLKWNNPGYSLINDIKLSSSIFKVAKESYTDRKGIFRLWAQGFVNWAKITPETIESWNAKLDDYVIDKNGTTYAFGNNFVMIDPGGFLVNHPFDKYVDFEVETDKFGNVYLYAFNTEIGKCEIFKKQPLSNWELILSDAGRMAFGVSYDGEIFLGNSDSYVYSNDGGLNFNYVYNFVYPKKYQTQFKPLKAYYHNASIYLADSEEIWKYSEASGWVNITSGLENNFVEYVNLKDFLVVDEKLFAAGVGGVYQWSKDEALWKNTGISSLAFALTLDYDGNLWASAVDNVYVTESPVTSAEDESRESCIKIYPNPASKFITIDEVAESVEFYNSLGALVKRCAYANVISVSDLPSGIYNIKLISNKSSKSFKAEIIK